eukprot:scaffold2986_cov406-Prasinococcus_capsulatus_cf.AAC.7
MTPMLANGQSQARLASTAFPADARRLSIARPVRPSVAPTDRVSVPPRGRRRHAAQRLLPSPQGSRRLTTVCSEAGPLGVVKEFAKQINTLSDPIVNVFPKTVPRVVAKALVLFAGFVLATWALKVGRRAVLNTAVTIVFLIGIGYLLIRNLLFGEDREDKRSEDRSPSTPDAEQSDDPLSQARNIMDKYN